MSQQSLSLFFSRYVQPNILRLCSGEGCEFGPWLMRRVLDCTSSKKHVKAIVDEARLKHLLDPSLPTQSHGVVPRLLEACTRLQTCTSKVAAGLFEAFGVTDEAAAPR